MTTAHRISQPLRVDRLEDGARRLVRELVIDLGVDLGLGDSNYAGFTVSESGTTLVTIPRCFETDFSSIPAVARPWFRFDKVDLAGCCHDLAYRLGVPRRKADKIWQIVATSGQRRVNPVRGWLGWLGLRIGGWAAFKPTNDPLVRRGSDNECPPD